MRDRDDLMDFTARLAHSAGKVTLEHFGGCAVEFKGDGSEVTAADHAAEEHIRAAIRERFPEDGVVGEEGEDIPSRSGRRWIVDPIDGTRTFSCGVPLYGVLVALEEEGEPVLGCCHFPALGETLVAARGAGTWNNGRRVSVSGCGDLASARLVTSGMEYWRDRSSDEHRAGFERLVHATRFTRTWGDSYGYFLVAVGRVELLVDPICGSYWDYAPMVPILAEAGGRLTTIQGGPLSAGSSLVASNGLLHEAAMRVLAGEGG
ncbi:MAG TPA: inositol monophosphatase family protein [Longimicrobiaceae bacterium]|nr:inositol monophosphatase family protein [Longimicrobiaceae bacterium]